VAATMTCIGVIPASTMSSIILVRRPGPVDGRPPEGVHVAVASAPSLAGYVTVTGPKHGDGTQTRGARRRRAFMLPILSSDRSVAGHPRRRFVRLTGTRMKS
jgi:hypothetical protein